MTSFRNPSIAGKSAQNQVTETHGEQIPEYEYEKPSLAKQVRNQKMTKNHGMRGVIREQKNTMVNGMYPNQ